MFVSTAAIAQVQNNGSVFVTDNAYMHLVSNNFNFGSSPAVTQTTRTSTTYGKIQFASGASWNTASVSHFLDGYARTYSNTSFLMPVGQSGVYAPAKVTPANSNGIDVAFYRDNPSTIGTSLSTGLLAVSSVEYWHILGPANAATISLTWRNSSDVLALTSNLTYYLPNIVIVGWNGSQWVEIPSTIDATSILGGTSTITAGSITSNSSVNLTTYNYFTFGLKDVCAPLITSSGVTKTWNGSWTPSAPTLADPVVINAPYSGTLSCNSLTLNADITLADGEYIEIVDNATGTGKIIMSSKASLVQRNSSGTAPNIQLTKTTRDMRRYDYVYWGTPIAGNFFSQIAGAQAQTASSANVFDLKYKYVSGPPPGNLWQTLTSITTGSGYITRVKQQAPFTNATNQDKINMTFTGVANNGDITIPVVNNPSCLNCGSSHNLLANPYASDLDAVKFLRENTILDGVIYLWTSNTPYPGYGDYVQGDYAVWNLSGTVNTSPISLTVDGKIASGQGFQVKALGNGNVTFTNCMRLSGASSANFFKMSEDVPTIVDRFKLNLTNTTDVFSQILIAYTPDATLGYDRLFDAGRNSVSTAQLYSIFEGDGRKLAINGRPTFDVNDVVPLGVSKPTTDSEEFSIGIQDREGIFNDGTANVYLHDKDLDIYHDLSLGNYSFFSNSTTLNERFEVVYQAQTLNNDDFSTNSVMASLNNNLLTVKAKGDIENIEIYDISGREIVKFNNIKNTEFNSQFYHAEGVYLAKIKLVSGLITTEKLININK